MIGFLRGLRSRLASHGFWYVLELAAILLFNLKFQIQNQRKLSKSTLGQSLTGNRKRVLIPLVETSHAKLVQMLLIGVALKLRGHRVLVLVCNGTLPICELRSSSNKNPFPCARCKLNLSPIVRIFKLELIELSEMGIGATELSKVDEALATTVKESVVRHFYGNLRVSKRELSEVEELHWLAAAKILRAAEAIEAKYEPDIVIGYMLVYSAWEPLINYFKDGRARVVSITSHFFDKHAQIIDGFELYNSRDRFDKFRLIAKEGGESDALDAFLRSRWGDYSATLLHESFRAVGKQRCSDRRTVLFCPNIHWDYGMDRLSRLFDSIDDWVCGVVPLAVKFPDIDFIVRAHPGEAGYTANESLGVCDLIRNHAAAIPENLKLLGPESTVKSYDLLAEADVVVVMNGTVGLEALLAQKQVIVTGSSPYAMLDGVFTPVDVNQYEGAISGKVDVSSPNYSELREYAYFYFLKTAVPWHLTPFSFGGSIYDPLNFNELSELESGKNSHIDHICDCIIDPEKLPESW